MLSAKHNFTITVVVTFNFSGNYYFRTLARIIVT